MVMILPMCLIMKWYVNVLTSLIWIEIKGLYSYNYYWAMIMVIFIQGLDPMTYIKWWWLIKTLKTFQKGLSLDPSELDNGKWWLPYKKIHRIVQHEVLTPVWGILIHLIPVRGGPNW